MKNPLTRSRLGEDNWLEPIIFVIYRLKWEKLNDLVNLYLQPEQGYGQQCSVSCYLKSCGLALFDVDSSVSRFKWVASRPGQRSFYTQGYDSGYVWNAGCRKYLSDQYGTARKFGSGCGIEEPYWEAAKQALIYSLIFLTKQTTDLNSRKVY